MLFIQGGSEGAYEADRLLADSLQKTLGHGYRVRYPRMPNEDDPQYEAWKTAIEASLAEMSRSDRAGRTLARRLHAGEVPGRDEVAPRI